MSLTIFERAFVQSESWNRRRQKEVNTLTSGLNLEDQSILNIGAGPTNLTQSMINQDVRKIVNVDVDDFPNIDIIADAQELPFEDGEFNVTVFLRVLHHVDRFNKALEEALRCTKSGGHILMVEPFPWMVKLTRASGLDSHPKNIITKENIERFAQLNKVNILKRWPWIHGYYYGYQMRK